MKMFRDMLRYRSRLAMGFQVAMAMFAHTKGVATTGPKAPEPKPKSPADQTSRYDFTKLVALASNPGLLQETSNQPDRRRDLPSMVDATWKLATHASGTSAPLNQDNFIAQPLDREQARLWLQAYNAGPYALLKYRGNVPFRETQNYAPRVLKYYMQDLSQTEYEPFIQQAAQKYGLDPQMIRAIMKTESDFRNSCVSGAGASGLMQVMPVVWSEIKQKYGLDWEYGSGVFDPQKNIEVACAYLGWLRYDFLPRHFAQFESDPVAPTVLVRDKDRGVPDRQGPRIDTAIASASPAAVPAAQPAPVAARATAPAVRVVATASKPKPVQPKAPTVRSIAKPEKITVEVAEASPRKTGTATRGGKTVVTLRGSGPVKSKAPGVAADEPEKEVASTATAKKVPPRTLKKPAIAQAEGGRDKGKRT
ncbi:MAG: lytic transglycosylase domain-containing protein [Candidatus Sumerlaeaceae bacterium]